MKADRGRWYVVLVAMAAFSAGCHLEQGKLYFDEIGLDPITVYKMAPLERTVYCLAEADHERYDTFDQMHERAIEEVLENPAESDWSELVCLSLSDEAGIVQLRQTVRTLDLVLSSDPQQSHPVSGFKRLMEQKIALYEGLEKLTLELETAEQDKLDKGVAYTKEIEQLKIIQGEQRKKIRMLEQQVRKLKDVELLLHPKQ